MFKAIKDDEIVIGFSTASDGSLIAATIRAVEGTEYSHVYTRYYSPGLERHMIYHSNIDNVNFTNAEHFLGHSKIIHEYAFKVTVDQRKRVIQKCIDRLSIRYGKMQLVGMGLVRLIFNWTGKRIKNPLRDGEKTQVCSELAGHVLIELGYPVDLTTLEVEGPRWLNGKIEGLRKLGHCRKL